MRRNPATRGVSQRFKIQRFDDRPRVQKFGDYRSYATLAEAIRYINTQLRLSDGRWRVRDGRKTVYESVAMNVGSDEAR